MAKLTKDHIEALRLLDEAHIALESIYLEGAESFTPLEIVELDVMIKNYLRRLA